MDLRDRNPALRRIGRPNGSGATLAPPAPLRMATFAMLADADYLVLVRTTAACVGGLLGLPRERVADLKLAVSEACAWFLDSAARREPEARGLFAAPDFVQVSYDRYPEELHVTIRAAVAADWPTADEFGWAVLGALCGDVRVREYDGVGELTLVQTLPR